MAVSWTIGALVALALFGIFVVMQQILSRVMYLEVALSQGIPASPGDAPVTITRSPTAGSTFDVTQAREVLPNDAIVVFASATCTTCIRLVDDLAQPGLITDAPLYVYFDRDAPRVASGLDGSIVVHDHADAVIDGCATPALPYGIIMRDGAVAAHGALPSLHRLTNLALGVGQRIEIEDTATNADTGTGEKTATGENTETGENTGAGQDTGTAESASPGHDEHESRRL